MKTQIKLALKVLARRKVFTAISFAGIAMTLAVLMVGTAILDNLFAPMAPESRFDRTLVVYRFTQFGPNWTMNSDPGYGFLDGFMRTLPGIERASIFSSTQPALIYHEGARIESVLKRTDGDYWNILDFRFVEGGPYGAADDENGRLVAVITEDMREKLFDGQSAVGREFKLEGRTFRVAGVVPNVASTRFIAYSQIWVPIGTMKSADYRTQMSGGFAGAVLARDRADIPRLQAEFAARMPRVPLLDPKEMTTTVAGLDTPFEYFARAFAGRASSKAPATRLRVILAVVALLFMLLPALNLITLNLSRILERAPEIGVRRAFGAPRRSLVGQFVFENVLMTLIGGLFGFALAAVLLPLLNRYAPVDDVHFALNLRVFAWGMLLATIFGVLSGLYPAWRMSRLQPVNALRGGAK